MEFTIHGPKPHSSYFQGGYRGYGKHQWCIKYRDWENEDEMGEAQFMFLGEPIGYSKDDTTDVISTVIGRTVEWFIMGRSGGWLIINNDLTEEEIDLMTIYIDRMLRIDLPLYLKEERQNKADDEKIRIELVTQNKEWIKASMNVTSIVKELHLIAGSDWVLIIRGLNVQKVLKGE